MWHVFTDVNYEKTSTFDGVIPYSVGCILSRMKTLYWKAFKSVSFR